MLVEQIKLENDEKIIKIVRKHWFILFKYIVGDLLLTLLPIIGYFVITKVISGLPINDFVSMNSFSEFTGTIWFFYLVWVLLMWIHFTNHITDYYLDLWVITDRRIVAIDQRGFFRRFLSSFRLERLQDMNIEIKGIIPTLLNYGTIEAQTAGGSNEEFKTANMPDPRGLKALIIRQADERQKITQYRHDQAGL